MKAIHFDGTLCPEDCRCVNRQLERLHEVALRMAKELEFVADCRAEGREEMERLRKLVAEFEALKTKP